MHRFISLAATASGILLVAVALGVAGEHVVTGAPPAVTPAGIPIQRAEFSSDTRNGVIYTVPPGKVLVLEHVFGITQSNAGRPLLSLTLSGVAAPGGATVTMDVVIGTQLDARPDTDILFDQDVRLDFFAGDIVVSQPDPAEVQSELHIRGRLVDAPH